MICKDEKKGPNQNFVTAWALGMNDYEIADSFGINVETLRAVKRDLTLQEPLHQPRNLQLEESDQSK